LGTRDWSTARADDTNHEAVSKRGDCGAPVEMLT
jgi:hypothetical protein